MSDVIVLKCAECNGVIEVDRTHLDNVIQFKGRYYHSSCFNNMAERKSNSKYGKPEAWKSIVDQVHQLESNTKKVLAHTCAKHEFNMHLLANYNIAVIPSRFWQVLSDLGNGKYKGHACRPINIMDLCDCWKENQAELDKISRYNKMHHKGPVDDNARLSYDLAIVVNRMPQYFANRARRKAESDEMANKLKEEKNIDYSKLSTKPQEEKLKDISDIVEDIF